MRSRQDWRCTCTQKLIAAELRIYESTTNAPSRSKDPAHIISRVTPYYPEIARNMHLEGIVKAEAVVDSSGKVKIDSR